MNAAESDFPLLGGLQWTPSNPASPCDLESTLRIILEIELDGSRSYYLFPTSNSSSKPRTLMILSMFKHPPVNIVLHNQQAPNFLL